MRMGTVSARRPLSEMINRHLPRSTRRLTLGADKGYDSTKFVAELRRMVVTPHVAQKVRHSAIDGRTTGSPGYACLSCNASILMRRFSACLSRGIQRHRKKIEEPFGWAKTLGGMAQTTLRGIERVCGRFTLTMAANNLLRLSKLLAWDPLNAVHLQRVDRQEIRIMDRTMSSDGGIWSQNWRRNEGRSSAPSPRYTSNDFARS